MNYICNDELFTLIAEMRDAQRRFFAANINTPERMNALKESKLSEGKIDRFIKTRQENKLKRNQTSLPFTMNNSKKILVLDTETTGLPSDMKAPATETAKWPFMLSIAFIQFTIDTETFEHYNINTKGFFTKKREGVINTAQHINGITAEMQENGTPIETVLADFFEAANKADYIVAHNVQFDKNIIEAEAHRLGIEVPLLTWICTKEKSADYLMIPPTEKQKKAFPQMRYKMPSLDELFISLYKRPIPGRETNHGAEQDARACANCLIELVKRGVIKI